MNEDLSPYAANELSTAKKSRRSKPSQPSPEQLEELHAILEELNRRKRTNKRNYVFDSAEVRNGYPKHLDFFAAGKDHSFRLFLAANRVGKTFAGAYETMLHATGDYPDWWTGRRFDGPTSGWVVGKTSETVRDTIQVELLGLPGQWGTGMLPESRIDTIRRSAGDRADVVLVKHKSGGISTIGFKTYDQGRQAFEGTARHYVWLDEEVPLPVYTECVLRTMTTNGIVYLTFTPLLGLTEVVLKFLPGGAISEQPIEGRAVVTATWDDAPHLSAEQKKKMWDETPPFQRDARSKGVPQLGAGAIYPVPESELVVDPFEIPKHFKRYAGMDVGWKTTAVCWFAMDPDTGVHYLFSDYARGQVEPVVHAEAIKSRGKWVIAIDPASRGRTQDDGQQLYQMYVGHGLDLRKADNAVETGLYTVWSLLSEGKLKIFKTCQSTLTELRMYRRDEKGNVVKQNDHNMDAMRYGIMTGRNFAKAVEPLKRQNSGMDEFYARGGFAG